MQYTMTKVIHVHLIYEKKNLYFGSISAIFDTLTESEVVYWRLADYLDVLNVLKGHAFVYFTSNKSSILELCDWMGRNPFLGNPFGGCRKVEFNASVNYNAKYTDMMLYTVPDEVTGVAA